MNNLLILDVKAMFSRAVNTAIDAGLSHLETAMILDAVRADVLEQVPFAALAEQRERLQQAQQSANTESQDNEPSASEDDEV